MQYSDSSLDLLPSSKETASSKRFSSLSMCSHHAASKAVNHSCSSMCGICGVWPVYKSFRSHSYTLFTNCYIVNIIYLILLINKIAPFMQKNDDYTTIW